MKLVKNSMIFKYAFRSIHKINKIILKNYILNNAYKNFSIKILSPNSLLFNHKKNIDRTQKFMTHMSTPKGLIQNQMTKEMDFEPGFEYFHNNGSFEINLFEREDNITTPELGFVQMIIPFDTNPNLQNQYRLLHTNRMRYGKLLELLDYFSGLSAYRYNGLSPKSKAATFVTASVDHIEIKIIEMKNPLIINAYPTWTGNSSMEIRMDLFSDRITTNDSFLGSAFFMYAMRNGADYSKKKLINPLVIERIEDHHEREKASLRFEIGFENKKKRIKESQVSLDKIAPNQIESEILHKLFVDCKKNKNFVKIKTIKDTLIDKSILMHSQNNNVNGHIFGGYVIKEALDAGYICAYMHSNREIPIIFAIDNVTFYKPVIIGSVAKFIANVCYVHEELIHVSVEVFNYVDENPTLTTVVNITYRTNRKTEFVYPDTYECGIKFLEAKRRLENIFDFI